MKECTLAPLSTRRAAWLLVAGQEVNKSSQIVGANSFLIYTCVLSQIVLEVLTVVVLLFWH